MGEWAKEVTILYCLACLNFTSNVIYTRKKWDCLLRSREMLLIGCQEKEIRELKWKKKNQWRIKNKPSQFCRSVEQLSDSLSGNRFQAGNSSCFLCLTLSFTGCPKAAYKLIMKLNQFNTFPFYLSHRENGWLTIGWIGWWDFWVGGWVVRKWVSNKKQKVWVKEAHYIFFNCIVCSIFYLHTILKRNNNEPQTWGENSSRPLAGGRNDNSSIAYGKNNENNSIHLKQRHISVSEKTTRLWHKQ